MKLTIKEIAEIAQVAKSTVSKALNGQKGVSKEKRKQILALAEELNYEASASAQALASSRSGSIGILIPQQEDYSLSGAYWSAIITSVAQIANEHNYSLLILTPKKGENSSGSLESVIRRRNVDGLIIGADQLDPKITSRLLEEEIPFVFIGRNSQIQHYSVDVDNFGGSERLVTHLIKSGYKKIACIAGPFEYLYTQERVAGYYSALNKAGYNWSAVEHTRYSIDTSRTAILNLLKNKPDFDAMYVTAGGEFLLDCIDILKLSGANPKKIAFGAFDDYRFFDYIDIPVCTIRQPLSEIATTTANLLFEFLSGKVPKQMNHILDVELILR
ncbi:MAG TPA: LacI family DNA-binding transcriptional regulator [Treponemataceae bacterium]|nr:LacI family DNA-binding transcriptional regulator [Treponemataceae bacterium]